MVRKVIRMLALVVIILIVLFFFGLRYTEQKMIYYPIAFPEGYWDPSVFPGTLEDCFFQADDGTKLHGWFAHAIQPRQTPIPAILFFHGNAGNLSHRITNITYLARLGVNVFIFDYRGYGRSEGTPNEQGLYLDAAAAYKYMTSREDVDVNHLVFFGRSLGGAVAVELALHVPFEKLILESTFTSAHDMVTEMFGGLPLHYLVQSKFDSLSKITQIRVPLLLIYGTRDTIVPFQHGKRLFAAANEPKWFYAIQDAGHNDTFQTGGTAYFEQIARFLQRNLEPEE